MAVRFATLLAPNTPNMPTLFAGAVVGIASGCTGGSMGPGGQCRMMKQLDAQDLDADVMGVVNLDQT